MRAMIAVAAALLTASPALAAERLTVERAMELALSDSPRIRGARAQLEAARSGADSLRGHMLPGLYVSDEQQHWDSPFALAFAIPGAPPGAALTVRNINTNTLAVSAQQPVLGLLHLSQDHAALSKRAQAAEADLRAAEELVREDVQNGFLRVFEARALEEIAQGSEKQLTEQLQVARSKLLAGVLTNADVLRLEVAAANARQQGIQAESQEQQARVALQETVGVQLEGTEVELVEPASLESAEQAPELSAALERALAKRPEVAGAELLTRAAQDHARASLFSLLPELNVEAAYTHVTGQAFAPMDSAFVGVKAEWPVFQWGARWFETRTAAAQAQAAEAQSEGTRRRVRTEVASRLSQVRSARSAVDVARAALTSAEEAYRVTDELVKAGSATTTDLLDAQSALSQARLNLVRSRYANATARVSLARATGG